MEASPRVICVLGMHRSGTSCLAGTLEQGGLLLGDVQTHNPSNLRGNRESTRIVALHDRVLQANGFAWDSPPEAGRELAWSNADRAERDAIIAGFAAQPRWGFKDPRSLLALEGWQEALPRMEFVGIFRHPLAVARSLQARGGMPLEQALSIWLTYNQRLLAEWRRARFPILSFDGGEEAFRAQASELGRLLGLPGDLGGETFFAAELRHHRAEEDGSLPPAVAALYAELRGEAMRVQARPAQSSVAPGLSVLVNAAGEATRTLQSLRAGYQLGVRADEYEVLVTGGGDLQIFGANFRDGRSASPRGERVAVLTDGDALLSPGLIRLALDLPADAVLAAPTYLLDESRLAQTGWPHATGSGDRLFDVATAPDSLDRYSFVAVSGGLFAASNGDLAKLSGVRWLLAAGEGTFHGAADRPMIGWPDRPFELHGPATRAARRLLGRASDLPLALGDGTLVDQLRAKNNELRGKIATLKLKNEELRARGDKWKAKAARPK